MAASALADVDTMLQAMLRSKPPGVSGSRINSIGKICVDNIQVRCLENVSPLRRICSHIAPD